MPWLRRKPLYVPPAPMESDHNAARSLLSGAFVEGLTHELAREGDALVFRVTKAAGGQELNAEVRVSASTAEPGRLDLRVQELNVWFRQT